MAPEPPAVFLDTAYVNALINTRDQWHGAAIHWEQKLAAERRHLITTEFILVEIADGLAAVRFRLQAIQVIAALRGSSYVQIVPASSVLVTQALDLYQVRADKTWGLTDCISFVVMKEHGVSEALTPDEDFRQAGFRPLLLDHEG